MKYQTLLFISIIVMNISMLMGYKITGSLAVSNIGQITTIALLFPVVFKVFKLKDYIIFLLISVIILSSSILFNVFTGLPVKEMFSIFFCTSVFLLLVINRVVKDYHESNEYIFKAFKVSAIFTLIYFAFFAIFDIVKNGSSFTDFGFDDKSHSVFVCLFYAFISLVLFKKKIKYIISILFIVFSFLTISRLSLLFMPFYCVAFIKTYFKEPMKKDKSIYLKCYFNFIFFFMLITGATIFIYTNIDSFKLFERLSGNGVSTASTNAHLMLIKYGLELKTDNIINFLIGVSPGGFSTALSHSFIDFSELSFIDPVAYKAILAGIAPMHSTHVTVLTEFSIIIFIFYTIYLFSLFKKLFKKEFIVEMSFFIPFLIAITFYSSLNELFFFSILIFLLATTNKIKESVII